MFPSAALSYERSLQVWGASDATPCAPRSNPTYRCAIRRRQLSPRVAAARNYASYANVGGQYDELGLPALGEKL